MDGGIGGRDDGLPVLLKFELRDVAPAVRLLAPLDRGTPQRQFGVSREELKAAKDAKKAEKKAAKEAQA